MDTLKAPPRLAHIDFLKALALFMMLLFHCTLYPVVLGPGVGVSALVRMLGRCLLSTCVPIFFLVNGYLLLGGRQDIRKHSRRILRLVVTASFWMLFLLLVLQPLRGEFYTWEQTRERFWSLQMDWNNHLWYLGVLVCIYLFYPVIKQAYDTNLTVFYYFTGLCFLLSFGNTLLNEFFTVFNRVVRSQTVVYHNFPFFHMFNPISGNFGMGLTYFCIGGVLRSLQPRLEAVAPRRRNLAAGVGLAVCCGLLLCLGYGYSLLSAQTWDVVWNGYDTVFTLGSTLCLFTLSLSIPKSGRLLRAVSENTLGVYLMHIIFQELLGKGFAAVPAFASFWGSCLYAGAVGAASLAVCLVLRRIPVLKGLI